VEDQRALDVSDCQINMLDSCGWHIPSSSTTEIANQRRGWLALGLRPADDGPYRYYGVGIEHLAFEVDRADEVDAAYGRCVAAGGKIQSPPERHYVQDGEDYYAFFAFDPDGIRIEVFALAESVQASFPHSDS
jgi:catechol 2,3-dioxygenase-like lactoylglutathione lyase family enzyme